jgi:hypothetical protein
MVVSLACDDVPMFAMAGYSLIRQLKNTLGSASKSVHIEQKNSLELIKATKVFNR